MDLERTQRLLRDINAKGSVIAKKLEDLLAGKDLELNDLQGVWLGDEDLPKEMRLRMFLDRVNRARARLLDGDFGRCLGCGADLDWRALGEMPWLERCHACELANV